MQKQSRSIQFVYFGAIGALVIVFGGLLLEKSQITNFYSKPITTSTATIRPVNSVEYTPADPTDNDEINQKKADGTLDSANSTAAGGPINVTITAATQDVAGGPVIIKLLLNDVTSGTCDITLKQNETTKFYSASVISAGNYYTCDGFEIPLEDLATGSWNMTATVTSTDRTGSANQNIEVK